MPTSDAVPSQRAIGSLGLDTRIIGYFEKPRASPTSVHASSVPLLASQTSHPILATNGNDDDAATTDVAEKLVISNARCWRMQASLMD